MKAAPQGGVESDLIHSKTQIEVGDRGRDGGVGIRNWKKKSDEGDCLDTRKKAKRQKCEGQPEFKEYSERVKSKKHREVEMKGMSKTKADESPKTNIPPQLVGVKAVEVDERQNNFISVKCVLSKKRTLIVFQH